MTLVDLAGALLSVLLVCCSMVTRPVAARCAEGWYVDGVRPGGLYECRRVPGGDPMYDGAAGFPDRSVDRPGWYRGRIWCGTGAVPIVVLTDREARSVGCQR